MTILNALSFIKLSSLFLTANAAVSIYNYPGQSAFDGNVHGTATNTATPADFTGLSAYDPTVLTPPAPPNPPITTNFGIQLRNGMAGLSIPQQGNFLGFSIEFSVVTQVIGRNSSFINVPFLNLMGNLVRRGGKVQIRIGGNTQETATLVPSLADGRALEKDKLNTKNPTETPPLLFTPEVIYMLGNVSKLANVEWFLGVPLNDTTNLRLGIADLGVQILKDKLKGLQVGNEPDLYLRHGHRPEGYGPDTYNQEFETVSTALYAHPEGPRQPMLVGPSIAFADWTPEMMWSTNFMTNHAQLKIISVERYPVDNCFPKFGVGTFHDPQETFPTFLSHAGLQGLVAQYADTSRLAQAAVKPLYMFETNTASCGGFPGISQSFGAALWALDYGMQMAFTNFSAALLHVGGQDVYYNPFTAAPTNVSDFRKWTVGPVYYSALIMAEAIGISNKAQIVDLNANTGNALTPAYAIYEDGVPVRAMLFNYVSDPSGANDITVNLDVEGVSGSIRVKKFLASSVAAKDNFTWAGQTFGGLMASDGRPEGQESIETVNCDPTTRNCPVRVPAPGVALIFFSDNALKSSGEEQTATTYTTTAMTKLTNTATVDPAVLATSNGHSGITRGKLRATSRGSSDATGWRTLVSSALCVAAVGGSMIIGALVLL